MRDEISCGNWRLPETIPGAVIRITASVDHPNLALFAAGRVRRGENAVHLCE